MNDLYLVEKEKNFEIFNNSNKNMVIQILIILSQSYKL